MKTYTIHIEVRLHVLAYCEWYFTVQAKNKHEARDKAMRLYLKKVNAKCNRRITSVEEE